MDRLFALSLGFAGLILLTAQVGHSQGAPAQCGPRADVMAVLGGKFSETRRGMGLAGPAQVVELFASASGSWTVTVTLPDGRTCLLASGEGWETLAEELPAKGSPA